MINILTSHTGKVCYNTLVTDLAPVAFALHMLHLLRLLHL